MAKKSYRTRIKVTKTGKLLRRRQGQSHARANKSRRALRRKDGRVHVSADDRREIRGLLEASVADDLQEE